MTKKLIIIILISFVLCGCKQEEKTIPEKKEEQTVRPERKDTINMEIKSSAFENEGMIPSEYTCDGKNISPQFKWENIPDHTKSLALICDDPDAPAGDWVHWVIFNIPPDVTELEENIPPGKELKNGTVQGLNDFRKNGYGGPCPPSGTHRYYFKLFALDIMLAPDANAKKSDLLDAMQGHILAQAQIMGKYKRQ